VLGATCVVLSCAAGAAVKHSKTPSAPKHSATHRAPAQTPRFANVSAKAKPKAAGSHKKSYARKKTSRVRGQAVPTPERIGEIQSALAKSGAYQGDPSGKWDDNTAQAMKHFQQVNGLSPTGKLNAPTLQKLGLGSEVAGRAAPRPEAPVSPMPPHIQN
jgi:peptidoglycan hydrolase-like protein with peptidoglycan-binding domain